MAKFKCRLSGNVIELVADYDIKTMYGHPDYDMLDDNGEIVPDTVEEKLLPFKAPIPTTIKRGRPKKAA